MLFDTRIIHSFYDQRENKGALVPPIYQTSTYSFSSAEEGAACFSGDKEGYIYTRINNPTLDLLEKRLADLEEGEAAICIFVRNGSHYIDFLVSNEPR
ncbi:Methionine gamma-lyase [Providencia stuartii]|nr:Methionine gamma-lyase [Providencia stuartii]